MIKVKVVGCGGYGGVGIVELLLRHPEAKIQTLVAATETGMPMSELYPHLKGFCDLPILKPDDPAAQEPADVVFFSTPDGVGMVQAPAELAKGARVIDYSGDFRFNNVEDYAEYARRIGSGPQGGEDLGLAGLGHGGFHRGHVSCHTLAPNTAV